MKRLTFIGLLLFSISSQAGFDEAYAFWKDAKYTDAVPLLLDYREQPYGKEMRVDYMLGTSYCRISGKEQLGKIYLYYAFNRYPYTQASRDAIQVELDGCHKSTRPSTIVVVSTLSTMGGAELPGVNSKMYYALDKRDKVVSNNMMEVTQPLSESELEARKLPLDKPDAARAHMREVLGPDSLVLIDGIFAYGSISSRHDMNDLRSIARQMNEASKFFQSAFDVELPDHFITVFLVPTEQRLQALAWKYHYLKLQDDTLGYSFQNDNSMLAINNSSSAGTLKHELAHFLVRRSFGDIPPWFDEGLAALYEVSYFDGEDLVGLRNWREAVLEELWMYIPPAERVTIEQIAAMNWADFNQLGGSGQAQATHHALARYFVLYLQNERYLPAVYRTFKSRPMDQRLEDIAAENDWVFTEATGKPLGELYKDFQRSVREFQKNLTRDEIITLQTHLEELGYSPQGIDGKMGQNTRAAINRLYKDRGLPKIFDVNREVIDIVLKF